MNLYVWKLNPSSSVHYVMLITLAESLEQARLQMREELQEEIDWTFKEWARCFAQEVAEMRAAQRTAEFEQWIAEEPVAYPTDTPMADWWEHDG